MDQDERSAIMVDTVARPVGFGTGTWPWTSLLPTRRGDDPAHRDADGGGGAGRFRRAKDAQGLKLITIISVVVTDSKEPHERHEKDR